MKSKRKTATSQRIYRELTPQERQRLEVARAETDSAKENVLAEGRVRKQAWDAMRREVAQTIATLKAERERLGLSLADVEARSGLKPSAISRLENDPQANPTLLTLQRYAAALNMTLATTVESV
ncbi:MAG: helix-turn-helix transcriptional regulator [Planctomycetota bacterium]|nr:helix-turn-helix transcriptional regulator [Planctomycetota bacterium]